MGKKRLIAAIAAFLFCTCFTLAPVSAADTHKIILEDGSSEGQLIATVSDGDSYVYEFTPEGDVDDVAIMVNGVSVDQSSITNEGRKYSIDLGQIYEDKRIDIGSLMSPRYILTYTYEGITQDEYPKIYETLPDAEAHKSSDMFTLASPKQTTVETGLYTAYFEGWKIGDEWISDGQEISIQKDTCVTGVWKIYEKPPVWSASYKYDKTYPAEVMATLPGSTEEIFPITPAQPSEKLVIKDGYAWYFDGWDKEYLDGTNSVATGSWTEYAPPDEYSRVLDVKFVDENGDVVPSGQFTDNKPYEGGYSEKIVCEYKLDGPDVWATSMTPGVAINPDGWVQSFPAANGYKLEQSLSVTVNDKGYRAYREVKRSASQTFTETETPNGFKPLEGSVKAYFNIEEEKITIESDDTGRAYVDGNTLYIVYLKRNLLEEAKDAAIEELDKVDTSVYSEPEKDAAEQALERAKEDVRAAATPEDVEAAIDAFKEALSSLLTDSEKKAISLEELKTAAGNSVDNYVNPDNYSGEDKEFAEKAIAEAKAALENAKSEDEVSSILSSFYETINALKTDSEKEAEEKVKQNTSEDENKESASEEENVGVSSKEASSDKEKVAETASEGIEDESLDSNTSETATETLAADTDKDSPVAQERGDKSNGSIVETGDENSVIVFAVLFMAAAIVVISIASKRKNG